MTPTTTNHTTRRRAAALAAGLVVLGTALPAQEGMSGPNVVQIRQEASSMADRIGAAVPRDLEFRDERDYRLSLSQFFPGDRPVLLNLGYFSCPSMCGQVTEAMVDALNEVDLEPGEDYQILTVSIDPREKPELAKERKERFLVQFHRFGAERGWRFAVGQQDAITALTKAVGFRYFWAEHDNRFDHPAALVFLSPDGRVSRVLQGTFFEPRDMRLALIEASQGKVGTLLDQIQLSCLTFDPRNRTYSLRALTVMKIGGVLTIVGLAVMLILMVRRERKRVAVTTGATPT